MTKDNTKRRFSKSRLMSSLQCKKRLYLEMNSPELAVFDGMAEANFARGNQVGEIAKVIFGEGPDIAPDNNLANALAETKRLMESDYTGPLYEATFQADGVLVRADVIIKNRNSIDMIEVKASTSVKEQHIPDCAIQAHVVEEAGYTLNATSLAHIDNSFVYETEGDYRGLIAVNDVTNHSNSMKSSVPRWIDEAQETLSGECPDIEVGSHCQKPYGCPFLEHCQSAEADVIPVTILGARKRLVKDLIAEGFEDVREVPQERVVGDFAEVVWQATLTGKVWRDPQVLDELNALAYPRYYLDFETVSFPIPRWIGTRPYQAIPFQWSCHIESEDGVLTHEEYLHDGFDLPVEATALSLLKSLGTSGPILMYSPYERRCIKILAEFCPDLADELLALLPRLVDMLPIVRAGYYHPDMLGSYSIKSVHPTVPSDASYKALSGIAGGSAADEAFQIISDPATDAEVRAELRHSLIEYCKLDTQAMVDVAMHLRA